MAADFIEESQIVNEMSGKNDEKEVYSPGKLYENICLDDYDVSKFNPVYYGWFPRRISEILRTDSAHMSSASQLQLNWLEKEDEKPEKKDSAAEFDAAVVHPATFGYVLLEKRPVTEENVERVQPLPDPKTCKYSRVKQTARSL